MTVIAHLCGFRARGIRPSARQIRNGSIIFVVAKYALWVRKDLVPAPKDTTAISAFGGQPVLVYSGGANRAPCMYTHKGISTQRSNSSNESQEGIHSEETIDG
ncbi:hypothetical protein PAXRUDRAFT_835703 [Paxillus rubicundulus Ve08.2h10]|uniref:Uncharacterized protein n=1 Tax=Paxillus rubicundulus Ve08.2h10 TaxID=930991 RepID=A0A0D0CJH1_9AGAM|nr:hypothetical protein PAXRUDRAFT_835703 [Paxillus rubicundulus Ve08.2h10]